MAKEHDINKPCPYCGSLKTKVDSKVSSNFEYRNGVRYKMTTASVRCKACHSRGPTVSDYTPSNNWDRSRQILADLDVKAYEKWNNRAEIKD